jgi:hypothetical protein
MTFCGVKHATVTHITKGVTMRKILPGILMFLIIVFSALLLSMLFIRLGSPIQV